MNVPEKDNLTICNNHMCTMQRLRLVWASSTFWSEQLDYQQNYLFFGFPLTYHKLRLRTIVVNLGHFLFWYECTSLVCFKCAVWWISMYFYKTMHQKLIIRLHTVSPIVPTVSSFVNREPVGHWINMVISVPLKDLCITYVWWKNN